MIPGIATHSGTVRDGVLVSAILTGIIAIMAIPIIHPGTTHIITAIMTGIIRTTDLHTGTDIMTGITAITGRYITAPAGPLNPSVCQPHRDMREIHAHPRKSSEGEPPEMIIEPVPGLQL